MKMDTMQSIPMAGSHRGFTIIELVVVILLLGILTATALPRFLDLNTEAHDAVIDGVEGGLRTGVALFRAQYIAAGSPGAGTELNDFGGVPANAAGYPGGDGVNTDSDPDGTFNMGTPADAHASCAAIYLGLLQGGAPTIVPSTQPDTNNFDQVNDINDNVGEADFVAKLTDDNICSYAYIGDAERTTLGELHGLVYYARETSGTPVIEAGTVERVTDL